MRASCCWCVEYPHTLWVWSVTPPRGTTLVTLTALCVLMRCWGLWRNCYNPTETVMTWGHIHLSWSSSPMPLLASCWLKHVAATASPPTEQPPSLPGAEWMEMKQEHVESDYSLGTLLCPPQSDDGDGRAWIFIAPDVNILACQPWTSPVPTSVHLYGSVKRWSRLYFATLPDLFPLFPLHFISELLNGQMAACSRISEND